MYYLYVLQSLIDGSFYLGSTPDLKRRFKEHNDGKNKSTKHSQWKLVYYEAYLSLAFARRREATLKRNERMRKLLYDRIKESLR